MTAVLLRCLESGGFTLGEARDTTPLSAAEVGMRLRGRLAAQTRQPEALQLLLPAARCLVTSVPVAKHEVKHLARTLPWTLEERLLEPAEEVHVAHGPVQGGMAAVSAVNAAWLQQVLNDLHAAGLQPQSAASEVFLLPWEVDTWSVYIPATRAAAVLVRHGAHAGFACAQANLQTALQLLLNEHGEAPRHIQVLAEAPAQVDGTALFPVLLQSRLELRQQSLEQLLHGATLPDCNLLQGRFAPALPWARWWREWRAVAAVLAGLLLTDLALSAYEAARLNRAAASLEAEVVALYRSVQPEGVVVDPRLQLEQALAAVGSAGQAGFLNLVSRMAPALQSTPEAQVQNLEYDSSRGDLQLQILTRDFAAAENLRAKLLQLGLQAELFGSSNDSAGSRTRLRVGAGA